MKNIYDKYGVNKNKIAVAGDSAGGNYAVAVSLKFFMYIFPFYLFKDITKKESILIRYNIPILFSGVSIK